jgi:hypothetical protein
VALFFPTTQKVWTPPEVPEVVRHIPRSMLASGFARVIVTTPLAFGHRGVRYTVPIPPVIDIDDPLAVIGQVSREEAIQRLEAAGVSLQPGTVACHLVDVTYPERPGMAFIEADYSQMEMRIAAQVGDRVRIGEDTVTERPAHYAPGGAALRYEATTRIRFPARRDRSGSVNPCGEIDLGVGSTVHTTVMKPKIEPVPYRSVWWWLKNPIV